jgi:hypothetical protein
MSVEMRQEVERKIAAALITQSLAAGYRLTIDNGGGEEFAPSTDAEHILREMFATDEEHLLFYNEEGKKVGWVYFVYGNDGWDVISDYSTNLEPVMTEANKISEYYS